MGGTHFYKSDKNAVVTGR